ncbi:hypothetical protein EVAR_80452_1 [Eumeta japonica]|uniref:non-specific serine/threonine protein kinase n=1 Tax=Eumeta variegata TaxID=151549 RepID=A0A4C1VGV8_EUMVA|nr:hypothetical protein EVAR_80452_1 [Eumeta japonica]
MTEKPTLDIPKKTKENNELKKLSEESLTRQPEEVFDIICKLGEGSYGSVYKALHKESGQVLAIKQVPVDTDLQEIIKEISIMQQCDSPYVVKYYGSYFKNTDLWRIWYSSSKNVLITLAASSPHSPHPDLSLLRGVRILIPQSEIKRLQGNILQQWAG